MKQVLWTEKAPAAIGPYSQGVREGEWIFVSGQIPLDPLTGQMVQGDVAAQSERVLKNIDALLAAAGATFADVVKTTVYLTDLVDFAAVNDVYGRWFAPPYPARATVQVAALPRGALVEIDAIAIARA